MNIFQPYCGFKKFLFGFLSFLAKKRISEKNVQQKSCSEYDFASNWSGQMSFGHKKWTEPSPMDIDWLFKIYIHRAFMVHYFSHILGPITKILSPVPTSVLSKFFIFFLLKYMPILKEMLINKLNNNFYALNCKFSFAKKKLY